MEKSINEHILKGRWKELKGHLQKMWGKLTDDEWEQAKGDATILSGIVQRKYGIQEEEFRQNLNKAMADLDQTPNGDIDLQP